MQGRIQRETRRWTGIKLGLISVLILSGLGCAVRRVVHIQPSQLPPPALEASLAKLVDQTDSWSKSIQTMTAKVDLEPTAGSVYSGVIKQYHDITGFILIKKPAFIRMIGQAPIVRTDIFDMVSNGKEFRVYVVPKQKFIVGKTTIRHPSKNALENLRPQHILEALLIPPIDTANEKYFREEAEQGNHRYYVIDVLGTSPQGNPILERKIWFDRSDLQITRLQLYGPGGSYVEDVKYTNYRDFHGIKYPTTINLTRPIEDYRLTINILEAKFNEPISPDKFELKKPKGAQLVTLSALRPFELSPRRQAREGSGG